MSIKLVVGLRNPGEAYQQTRHNAGGWLVSLLATQQGVAFQTNKKFQCETAALTDDGWVGHALLPLTFMNVSGLPVRAFSQFYRILPHEILVVHDDLDLPPGRVKLKTGGGHGGHNGLRDLIAQLGTADFHRLRIGIGHPGDKSLVLNYVLGKPSLMDRNAIFVAIDHALEVMPMLLSGHMAEAMTRLNR
jgi:PTH1 family peptidyl-tRNA hydrolase